MSAAAQDRLLSLRDVLRLLGCDLGSLGRLQVILGSLPAAQRQADGSLRWRLADVESWGGMPSELVGALADGRVDSAEEATLSAAIERHKLHVAALEAALTRIRRGR